MVLAHIRPPRPGRGRCGVCGHVRIGTTGGKDGTLAGLDLGTVQSFLEADAPRLSSRHRATVRQVPSARTAPATPARSITGGMARHPVLEECGGQADEGHVAHRGSIFSRVWADVEAVHDRFAGLRRIGSMRSPTTRPQVPHRRGRPRHRSAGVGRAGSGPGHSRGVLRRSGSRTLRGYHPRVFRWSGLDPARGRPASPNAVRCTDPFHVVRSATDALDAARTTPGTPHAGRRAELPAEAGPVDGPRRRHPPCQEPRTCPLGAMEEPREPRLAAGRGTGLDRRGRPSAPPGLPSQGGATADLPASRSAKPPSTRDLDRVGPPLRSPLHRNSTPHRQRRDYLLAAIEHGLSNGRIDRSTPRFDSSPASPSGSAPPRPSSPSQCSVSSSHQPILPRPFFFF